MTDKNRACPFCKSHNIAAWILGKLKCRNCDKVFPRTQALQRKYKPKTRRPTRRISDRQEKHNAKTTGGKTTIASGSTPVDKGDVKADLLRMECKSTEKKSFRLTLEDFEKIEAQAKDDEMPVFNIEFRRGGTKKQLYVINEGYFLELLELHRSDQDD
jgi:hypothetical protein